MLLLRYWNRTQMTQIAYDYPYSYRECFFIRGHHNHPRYQRSIYLLSTK